MIPNLESNKITFVCLPGYHISKKAADLPIGKKVLNKDKNGKQQTNAMQISPSGWAYVDDARYAYNDFGNLSAIGCLPN